MQLCTKIGERANYRSGSLPRTIKLCLNKTLAESRCSNAALPVPTSQVRTVSGVSMIKIILST